MGRLPRLLQLLLTVPGIHPVGDPRAITFLLWLGNFSHPGASRYIPKSGFSLPPPN